MAGLKMQHIPYKGAGPAVTDLVGGQVQLSFQVPSNVLAFVKSGRLKALAISGESRLPSLPQVPTFSEAACRGSALKSGSGSWRRPAPRRKSSTSCRAKSAESLPCPTPRKRLSAKGWIRFSPPLMSSLR